VVSLRQPGTGEGGNRPVRAAGGCRSRSSRPCGGADRLGAAPQHAPVAVELDGGAESARPGTSRTQRELSGASATPLRRTETRAAVWIARAAGELVLVRENQRVAGRSAAERPERPIGEHDLGTDDAKTAAPKRSGIRTGVPVEAARTPPAPPRSRARPPAGADRRRAPRSRGTTTITRRRAAHRKRRGTHGQPQSAGRRAGRGRSRGRVVAAAFSIPSATCVHPLATRAPPRRARPRPARFQRRDHSATAHTKPRRQGEWGGSRSIANDPLRRDRAAPDKRIPDGPDPVDQRAGKFKASSAFGRFRRAAAASDGSSAGVSSRSSHPGGRAPATFSAEPRKILSSTRRSAGPPPARPRPPGR
jgi:hypothetical protein